MAPNSHALCFNTKKMEKKGSSIQCQAQFPVMCWVALLGHECPTTSTTYSPMMHKTPHKNN